MSKEEFMNEFKRHLWGLLSLFVRYFYGRRITAEAFDAWIQRAGPAP